MIWKHSMLWIKRDAYDVLIGCILILMLFTNPVSTAGIMA